MAQTIGAAWHEAAARLPAADAPAFEAQLLLAFVLDMDRAALLAYPDRCLTPAQAAHYARLVDALTAGTPLPYLTGRRAFYRHEFTVTPDVLIPRPETEHLVEAALQWAQTQHAQGDGLTLADVGTGSGAIALSLAAALPKAQVWATDISPAALTVAAQNARDFGLNNVQFAAGDLLAALPTDLAIDLLAANLPYIARDDLPTLAVSRHEPHLALDGGPDGLDSIRRLVAAAPERLAPGGCLLLEIGAAQGAAVGALCAAAFPAAEVRVLADYAGHERVVQVTR